MVSKIRGFSMFGYLTKPLSDVSISVRPKMHDIEALAIAHYAPWDTKHDAPRYGQKKRWMPTMWKLGAKVAPPPKTTAKCSASPTTEPKVTNNKLAQNKSLFHITERLLFLRRKLEGTFGQMSNLVAKSGRMGILSHIP